MKRRTALPLAEDGSVRFLPWLIALMAYLAALSTCAAFAIGSALERWDSGLRGTLTAELPQPVAGPALAPERIAAALELVRATPGVSSATALDAKSQMKLLEPWLGQGVDSAALPLPVLVDIHLEPGGSVDPAALAARVGQLVPGTLVETHGAWLANLFRVARLIELGAGAIVGLVAAVAVVTVVFATRTGFTIHLPVIDLLHLMGAPDGYVARQFERHAFRLGLRGGLIGLVLALLSFAALKWAVAEGAVPGGPDLMPGFRLPVVAWLAILVLPLATGLVALLTARITVLRALARMP